MSSTSSLFPSQTTSPDNSNGGNSSMQRGANYFFGFLITFVALLLLFVGCGIGSRRRSRRRGLMASADDPWGDGFTPQSRVTQPEPDFWEPSFTKGGDDWGTMMPLSMTTISQLAVAPSDTTLNPSNSRTSHRHRFLPSFSYHPWLSSPRQTDSDPGKPTVVMVEQPPVPQTLQVSMMIAMPSMHRYPNDRQEDPPPVEYQLGIVQLPWDKGL
ncbi:hypothetical protein BDN72DRAFT_956562 [Pluteus cervinus]|uniref:Uncharacterized protein n=1 Tax=Pluteus cervinus TaxID=181527 RepID=A0ACD3B6G1_9AGAR|nr:hypothetical protein BDN72DRAFT_956562 [Pluteus cervinus]